MPSSGTTAGGTKVTLAGRNLAGALISFGGTAAQGLVINMDGTQITTTTPPRAEGAVRVTATTPGGSSGPVMFTFCAPPALDIPTDHDWVPHVVTLEGGFAEIGATVWPIVNPIDRPDTWFVQGRTQVGDDRRWSAEAYVGEAGTVAGTRFQIHVVINPVKTINKGDILDTPPDAEYSSNTIRVKRQ